MCPLTLIHDILQITTLIELDEENIEQIYPIFALISLTWNLP
jgi:hypothetical protein